MHLHNEEEIETLNTVHGKHKLEDEMV